jgi:hypothetical protein
MPQKAAKRLKNALKAASYGRENGLTMLRVLSREEDCGEDPSDAVIGWHTIEGKGLPFSAD